MIKISVVTAISLALLSSLSANEMENKDNTKKLKDVNIVDKMYEDYASKNPTSAMKTNLEWLEVPQAVSMVTNTEIQDKGATKLVEALDGVAGITNTLGEGSRDQFVIRGFDSLNDTYKDGLRDDANLQSYRSLANIDHVEVIKGPAGALYGRGSAGGIINLVTKRAKGEEFTKLALSLGSENKIVSQIDFSTAISDKLFARINLERRQGDSYVNHVDFEDYFIAPTFRYKFNDKNTFDFDVEYSKQELVPYRGVPSKDGKAVNVSEDTFYGSKNDYQESTSLKTTLNHETVFNDNLKLNNRASYTRFQLEQSGTRQGTVTGNTVTQTVNNFEYDPRTSKTVQSELTWDTNNNQLLVGVDYNEMDIELKYAKGNLVDKNIYTPNASNVLNPGFNPWRYNETKSTGYYLQNVYNFGSLSLIGGLRHDRTKLMQQKIGNAKEHLDDKKTSYRLGAVYKITPDISTYVTYAKSWQLPYGGIYINPKLSQFFSTKLKEAGAKAYLLDDALMINASIFRINQEQPQTNTSGDIIKKIEAEHTGFELEIRGQITDKLSISSGYTYLDAKDVNNKKSPNDVADQLFSISTAYQATPNFRLGGMIKYVGNRFAGNNEAVELSDYTTVNLMSAYNYKKHQIQLNANNIFDEKYILGATGGKSGKNQLGYGEPRSFMLTYKYTF